MTIGTTPPARSICGSCTCRAEKRLRASGPGAFRHSATAILLPPSPAPTRHNRGRPPGAHKIDTASALAPRHALGCALVEEDGAGAAEAGVYAFGTQRSFGGGEEEEGQAAAAAPGQIIRVFASSDHMHTWQNKTAIDFSTEKSPSRKKRVVFNTSVGKGKLNGTTVYVMAYEWSRPGTPGGWNTNFAVSKDLKTWELLDDGLFAMPTNVEHADPTIRSVGIVLLAPSPRLVHGPDNTVCGIILLPSPPPPHSPFSHNSMVGAPIGKCERCQQT